MRPRIGITCDLGERGFPEAPRKRPRHLLMDAYVEAVLKAGGAPLLLPAVEDERAAAAALAGVRGLIISGNGRDLDPALYGEERLPACGAANPRREAAEMAACRAAMSRDMPVLGICGGQQLLNVVLGGTLIQHVPDETDGSIAHEQPNPRDEPGHDVTVVEGTLLHRIVDATTLSVNSAHHQAVRDAAADAVVNATAPDGVVEGIEAPTYRFCLGVQWHPEFFIDSADEKIFRAFVAQAAG